MLHSCALSKDPILPGSRKVPRKKQGHSAAETLKAHERRLDKFDALIAQISRDILELTMNSQDLASALAHLKTVIDNLPAPQPQLISQAELDQAVAGVNEAIANLQAKLPTP